MSRRKRSQIGVSMLEAAGVLLIGSMLVFCAAGVVSYYQIFMSVADIVNKQSFNQAIRPIKVSNGNIIFDDAAAQAGMHTLLTQTLDDLQKQMALDISQEEVYFLQIQVAKLSIDSTTGSVQAVQMPSQLRDQKGSLQIPPEIEGQSGLETAIHELLNKNTEAKIFAIPAGSFGVAGSQQYLPWSAVIAVRLLYSFDK